MDDVNTKDFSDSVPCKPAAPLLGAFTSHRPSVSPIWFMRQAGRSLPEYRKARAGIPMLDACLRPDLAAEITCQPVRRHGVDAAVFFSDIMVPLRLAGVEVDIKPGIGPVFPQPIQSDTDIAELCSHRIEDPSPITEAVRLATKELSPETSRAQTTTANTKPGTPVLAFAGAPFTLAAYLIEGKPSKDHLQARTLMHANPEGWKLLMSWCAQISIDFMRAQIAGGAQAFQLFDSWAGSLSREDYVSKVAPYSAMILAAAKTEGVPTIHFGTGTGEILPDMRAAGADCIGVDYRIPLDQAVERLRADVKPNSLLSKRIVVQGNIDPSLLAAPWSTLEAHVRGVMECGKAADGHIVNLGHGVPPQTDPTVLTRIVELVHSL